MSVKVLLAAVSGPVLADPAVARLPDHAPDAVQDVALVELHVKFEDAPLATLVGLALSATVGTGGEADTVTTVDALAEPPVPLHVSVKVLLAAVSGPLLAEPEVARLPDQAPDAVQDVASVELHVTFEGTPLATLLGLALSVIVGAGDTALFIGGAADSSELVLLHAPTIIANSGSAQRISFKKKVRMSIHLR